MRVFKYGLLPPTSNELESRRQLRALHEYRNYLVMIERARREAIRAVDRASPEVLEAETGLIAATRSAKREARKRLLNLSARYVEGMTSGQYESFLHTMVYRILGRRLV